MNVRRPRRPSRAEPKPKLRTFNFLRPGFLGPGFRFFHRGLRLLSTVYTVYMQYNFVFSKADGRPMYQQIMDQIAQRIAVGDWPPNTPLPSVRELAADIKVSVITIKRAYLELGRAGVIVTQQGKGTWVSGVLDMETLQRDELAEHLAKAGQLAKSLAIPERELLQMLKKYT